MAPFLEISEARCRIGRHNMLSIKQLEFNRGEHWCVFGPNGAGKSLLARLLAGQMRETSLYVKANPEFDASRHVFQVSFEEQQRLWQRDNRLDISEYSASAQDPGTTVEILVRAARHDSEADDSLVSSLLEELGLAPLRAQGIRYLSSGQVRKALLARALYGVSGQEGGLLLLDDPLESIDRQSREKLAACIRRYLGDDFISVFLCRRYADIPDWATHLAVMDDLQLITAGPRASTVEDQRVIELSRRQPVLPDYLPVKNGSGEAAGPDNLLELKNVDAAYSGKPVLEKVNWTMRSGDHVLLEGPNGCGKSTLLSLIDGDNHMGYGQDVRLFGRQKGSGESIWELKAGFGVVSNELHNKYVKGWRVLDVVVSGFYDSVGLYDDSGSLEKEQALKWLSALQLEDFRSHYYHELSFGQQRLVLLARAMVKGPAILILDESCVGLDDYHRSMILGILDLIAEQTATQLIYVSHVIGEQLQCINRRYRFEPTGNGTHTLRELQD